LFRSEAPMCQMNYADALEKDGVFGERAETEWRRAGKEWEDYGKLDIPTSDGRPIRLGQLDRLEDQLKQLNAELDKLVPGAREKLFNNKVAMLTDAQREAMKTPYRQRADQQHQLAAEADALIRVTADEVARQAGGANRAEANELLDKIHDQMETIRLTKSYQGIVNYDYWGLRAEVEQTEGMREARRLVYEADTALPEGNLPVAYDRYSRGAVAWAGVLAKYPQLMTDQSTIDDLDDLVKNFAKALDQREELFPEDFALRGFVGARIHTSSKYYPIERARDKAEKAVASGDYRAARTQYEELLGNWRLTINETPTLEQRSDPATVQEILSAIGAYAKVLAELKVPFPDGFNLQPFVWTQVEHDPKNRDARAVAVQGSLLADQKKFDDARAAFDEAFSLWRGVLDRYPSLIADKSFAGEIVAAVNRYQDVLKQQNQKLPEKFILQDVLDRHTKK
jgi:tetratricopeptide (TPR) repeat protein